MKSSLAATVRPLEIELFTARLRVRGKCRAEYSARQFQDVLALPAGVLTVESAWIEELGGRQPTALSFLSVEKANLIAAFAYPGKRHRPSIALSGRVVVVVTAPPLVLEGLMPWAEAGRLQRYVQHRSSGQAQPSFVELQEALLFRDHTQLAGPARSFVQCRLVRSVSILDQNLMRSRSERASA